MAKFPSIWGDLEVGHVAPKDDKKVIPKAEDKKGDEEEKKVDDEDSDEAAIEAARIAKEEADAAAKGADEEETGEATEYEDEFIESAFNLLIDEGVLAEPVEGEDGFDVSPAGLADSVGAAIRKGLAEEIAAIPDEVQQFYAHFMEGKDPSSFKVSAPIIWDDVNLETGDNKETALLQFYVNQGMSVEDAQEEVEDVKTAGKLDKKAEIARDSLVKIQETNKTAKDAQEAKAKAQAQKEADDEINAIKATIDSVESIAEFKLDDKRRAAFKEYLFKVKPRTGKTQMQENMSSEDRRLNIAFLDFVNYNKEDLKKEVATDLTKTRKKKLARFSDKGVKGSNSSKSVTTKVDSKKGKAVFPTIFGSQSMEVED